MTIRDLDPERDAESVVALISATNPTTITNVEEWRHRRRAVPERARALDLVAELDGRLVGVMEAGLTYFGSGELGFLGVRVDPDFRNRGVGSQLYDRAVAHAQALGVPRITVVFDETDAGVAFATKRGWREERAETLSVLDPRGLAELPDPAIELVPVRDLDTHELHRIDEEATHDLPAVEEIEAIPYEDWLAFVWDNPLFTREGSFGAVVDGRVAAVSFLLVNRQLGRGLNMFTATGRAYRGRGLALAAKLASTHRAAANGITQIATTNDEDNAPMLAINRRLGYRASSRRVEYTKDL
jgi:GNAT superfamily N-acetyltransferase